MRFYDNTGAARPARGLRRARRLAAVAVLLVLAAAACSADDSTVSSDTADASSAATFAPQEARGEGESVAIGSSADSSLDEVAQDDGAQQLSDDASGGSAATPDPAAPIPPPLDTAITGERIIKEGTVTLEVDPGDFDAAFGQIISRARALGGHVAGTSSSTTDGPDEQSLVSGQVTIRIPVRNFEDLLTTLGDAGRVIDRDVTSQDVTAEFTDLESRRRNLQAQERFYLGLLDQAASVPDAIAVQQQLDGIQGQIEQITGRINLLEDRTSFSTLTVRIRERGVEIDPVTTDEPAGFAPYLQDAANTFVTTVGAMLIFLTFITPFALLALAAFGVYRMVRRRRHSSPVRTGAAAHSELPRPPVPVGASAPAAEEPQP
ncbi:MAG: DUF4349 domain-containing protein [Euzebya sp.]